MSNLNWLPVKAFCLNKASDYFSRKWPISINGDFQFGWKWKKQSCKNDYQIQIGCKFNMLTVNQILHFRSDIRSHVLFIYQLTWIEFERKKNNNKSSNSRILFRISALWVCNRTVKKKCPIQFIFISKVRDRELMQFSIWWFIRGDDEHCFHDFFFTSFYSFERHSIAAVSFCVE